MAGVERELLLSRHSMFERTSRDSARPVVTLARTRSVRRLPTVTVGSVRPVFDEYELPKRNSSITGTA
jgi:hypothetical protein